VGKKRGEKARDWNGGHLRFSLLTFLLLFLQFAFDESQKKGEVEKGGKSPSHFCIHPRFSRPLSLSACVLFAQLSSN